MDTIHQVIFQPSDRRGEIESGRSLLEAVQRCEHVHQHLVQYRPD